LDALQAGLLGLGTVGTGVARILTREAERLRRRTGVPIRLKRVVDLDLERDRGVSLEGLLVSRRAADILEDSEIAVVMELIGGIEPARTFILEALARGKHVVTANKALLASHGPELFKAAAAAGAQIGFEASVCGGIPILGCLREGLAADRVRSLAGIVNGTSNYILSSMTEKRLDFSGCLREAQAEGYAEADPTLDINGKDAAHKLAILVGVAHGVQVDPERIFTEGIEQISGLEIRYAADLGYRIKLLALSKFCDGELEVRVHPTMIPEKHLLAGVNLAFNAVYLTGENTGPLMFYGQGAGMMPTGSAVVGDLISIGRRLQSEARRPAPPGVLRGTAPDRPAQADGRPGYQVLHPFSGDRPAGRALLHRRGARQIRHLHPFGDSEGQAHGRPGSHHHAHARGAGEGSAGGAAGDRPPGTDPRQKHLRPDGGFRRSGRFSGA